MTTLILIVHIITCVLIVFFVLLQPGDGAGSMFGGSSTGTVFGGAGPVPFLAKLTGWGGAIFFATSLLLSTMESTGRKSLVEAVPEPPAAVAPGTEDGTAEATTGAANSASDSVHQSAETGGTE